jgi:hypothetical protein
MLTAADFRCGTDSSCSANHFRRDTRLGSSGEAMLFGLTHLSLKYRGNIAQEVCEQITDEWYCSRS